MFNYILHSRMNHWSSFVICLGIICGSFLSVSAASSDEYDGPWRKALDGVDSCWSAPVASCNRVMTTSHGGDWNAQYPYDSLPAFQNAFANGADAVKGDFRVSLDNVGMVMHSSPIEIYESLNCKGKYVEKMTAAECEQCNMAYTNYTFISVPKFLEWAENKVNVMLCVKESTDLPRAITTLLENNASHRAFLEVDLGDYLSLEANNIPHWNEVYYVVQVNNDDQINTLLSSSFDALSRAILFEFHHWQDWPTPESLSDSVKLVQSKNRRTFAATQDSPVTATVADHMKLFETGFDVAYTYNLGNAVVARVDVNTERNISPP